MLESVLLLLMDLSALELCPTAGVQARGTLTVLTMDCAGQNYWSNVLCLLTVQPCFSFDGCADTCVDGPQPQSKPQPRPTSRPQPKQTPRPTPRPQPVVFEEEVIITTRRPTTPRRTTPRPTPPAPTTYRPSFTTPITTTGYNYETPAPDVQLVINRPSTPDPGLPSLYGPPAPARRGRGRKGRRG